MVLVFILMTLMVLAVSISASEKVLHLRRNSKTTNKSAYEKTTYFHKNRKKYYKFMKYNPFLFKQLINLLQSKQKKRNSRMENKKLCEKKNDNIIPWPKD